MLRARAGPAELMTPLSPFQTRASLWILAALFAFAGAMHFVIPQGYMRIMPRWLPEHRMLVLVSGACELLGGIGLLIPALRQPAAWALLALLVAVFPANIQMLQSARGADASGWTQSLLWLRLPLQPLLMWWIYRAAIL